MNKNLAYLDLRICFVWAYFVLFLFRQIQDFKGENCRSAKLFAKHMKVIIGLVLKK